MAETQKPEMAEAVDVDTKELVALGKTSLTLLERARELTVSDQASFERCEALYGDFLAQEKAISALFDPIQTARYRAYQRVQKLHKERLDELAPGKALARDKGKAYLAEQERLRREAEEAARRERERAEREAEEARAAEERRLAQEAEERRLAAAIRAEEAGDRDVAEAILEQPAPAVFVAPVEPVFTPPPAVVVPEADLRKFGKKWVGRVRDVKLACRSIAEGLVSERLVEFKKSELNNLAKSLGGVREIPGFEFRQE